MTLQRYVQFLVGLVGWGGVVSFTAYVNLMYVGRPAVMISAILAARYRTFVLIVTSLFVLFVFLCTINFFFLFSLSVLTAIFQRDHRIAGFVGANDGSGDDNWICKTAVKSSPPTNQHPPFLLLFYSRV